MGSYMIYNWYSTSFTVPSSWTGDKVLLNFGAVDYEATVFVNGKKVGFNRGGYFAFTLDITSLLQSGSNELYAGPASTISEQALADQFLGWCLPTIRQIATHMSFQSASRLSVPRIYSTPRAVVFGRVYG